MKKVNRTAFGNEYDDGPSAASFCNVVAAVVGTGLVTAAVSADASRSAANKQSDAATAAAQASQANAANSNALQMQMYNQNIRNNQPALQTGQTALAALAGGLGLGSQYTNTGTGATTTTGTSTPTTGVAGTTNATTSSPDGTTNYGATTGQLADAANTYANKFTTPFTADSLSIDPSYQFRLQQGNQALAARQLASGTYATGQGLKDVSDYNQSAASQEYQAAFNRDQTTKNQLYTQLAGLAGVGTTATSAINAAGTNTANAISANNTNATNSSNDYNTSAAASQAAGTVGQANAWNSAINSGTNAYTTMQILNGQNNPWAKSSVAQRGPTSDQITLADGTTFSK